MCGDEACGRTGLDAKHDLIVGQNGRDWQHAARQGLAEHKNVGPDSLVITGQHLAGAAESGLNFVSDEEHIRFLADSLGLCAMTHEVNSEYRPSQKISTLPKTERHAPLR